MLNWWNVKTTISSGWPMNVYRRQSIFGGYRFGKSGDVKVPPWGLSELLYTTQEQPVKKKECHIDVVYDKQKVRKVRKNNTMHMERWNNISTIFDSVELYQHCKLRLMCLVPNDFNVEISGLVDNEIHHLTLLAGWGTRARERKVFLFPKWSCRASHRSNVFAFVLPAVSNAKLKELN